MNENETKRHIVYLSGPITGNPYYKQQFALAEKLLRKRGYLVINPASLVLEWADAMPEAERWTGYITFDLCMLDALQNMVVIYFLPGTGHSKGSRLEYAFAVRHNIPWRYILDEYANWNEMLEWGDEDGN